MTKSKLFNLKEWLTIPDSAKHLSIVFGEEVTEADVLRLALDGHLALSVNFVNGARAKRGRIVRYAWAEVGAAMQSGKELDGLTIDTVDPDFAETMLNIPEEHKGKPVKFILNTKIDDDGYLDLDNEAVIIDGVWDLPMVGEEKLAVMRAYQELTGGPDVTMVNIEGPMVWRGEDDFCVLQESYDNNSYVSGSNASLNEIRSSILINNLDKDEANRLLSQHAEDCKKYLEKRNKDINADYYPADELPKGAVFVVRTSELRKFEQQLGGNNGNTELLLKTNERNSLLTVIAALCDYSAINPKSRGAAQQIAQLTEDIGAAVGDDTIRKILLKIPDALETRMK